MTSQEEENYNKFIIKYCCPDNAKFNRRKPITNPSTIEAYWTQLLLDYANVDQDAIRRYLRHKKYKNYYLTTYWWYIISHKRKLMDGMLCSENGCNVNKHALEVHHLTYEHLGEEIKFMDDLITVCPDCHDAIHGKKRKKKVVASIKTDDIQITSDPKKYVITIKTHELPIKELRTAIINNIDIVLDVLS